MSVSALIFCIANFIDECKWCCSNTDLTENVEPEYVAKYRLNFSNLWLKYLSGLTGVSFSSALIFSKNFNTNIRKPEQVPTKESLCNRNIFYGISNKQALGI